MNSISNKQNEAFTVNIVCSYARKLKRTHGTFAASQYLKKHGFGLHTALRVLCK